MRAGLAALARSERGVAMPVVLAVMVISLAFSAVAIVAANNSQTSTKRDQRIKSALAIADAGAQRALFTYTKIETSNGAPCVAKNGSGDSATLTAGPVPSGYAGWCTKVGVFANGTIDPDSKVGDGYFTYWVNACNGPGGAGDDDDGDQDDGVVAGELCNPRRLMIVSEGCSNTSTNCANGITRRVAVRAWGKPGSLASGTEAKAVGLDEITMDGWSELEVDAATNGDFVVTADNGCPNDTAGRAGCPRICVGDYAQALRIWVGPEKELILPDGTQRCNADYYRVNPPGPPESDLCNDPSNVPASLSGCAAVEHRVTTLDPVDITAVNASNSNGRLGNCTLPDPAGAPDTCELDAPAVGKDTASGTGTVSWNSATRTLNVSNTNISQPFYVTLGGNDYSLCKLNMSGRVFVQGANKERFPGEDSNVSMRVYFDSPEACELEDSDDGVNDGIVTQLSVRNFSKITNSGWCALCPPPSDPNALYHMLPLFAMVGSTGDGDDFIPTEAEFQIAVGPPEIPAVPAGDPPSIEWWYAAGAWQALMLYAPSTNITLDTGYARENEGWFAGKRLDIVHGSEVESPPDLDPIGVGIASSDYTRYDSKSYVECGRPAATPNPPNAPDANC